MNHHHALAPRNLRTCGRSRRTRGLLCAVMAVTVVAAQAGPTTAPDLSTVLDATAKSLRKVVRAGNCNANPWQVDSEGHPLNAPCAPVVATCPAGTMPIGKGEPYVKCKARSTAPWNQGFSAPVSKDVSLRQRTLSCVSVIDGPFGEGYTADCVYAGLLPDELAAVSNFEACSLPACDEQTTTNCSPSPDSDVLVRGVDSGTQSCTTKTYLAAHSAQCYATEVTSRLTCAKQLPERTLRLLGIDPD